MKIWGALVDILLEIDPEKCKDFVIDEVWNKGLHENVTNALHVMLMVNVSIAKKSGNSLKQKDTRSTHVMFAFQTN